MTPKNSAVRLLLVEDDPTQRMLLSMTMSKEGYAIQEAENGLDALEKLSLDPELRLVITDIDMPKMNGLEFITEIRKKEMHYTYIIVLTAHDDRESMLKALEVGADDFLSKPVIPEEIRLRMKGGQRLLQLEGQQELIMSMAKMADYRSEETGFHLERVKHYTRLLARDLSVNSPELDIDMSMAEEIAKVSPLHDIGKVAIPDSILKKPGKLSDEEFLEMQKHATIGGELIAEIFEKTGSFYLKLASELTMYHHEKFNGKGYPFGLSGDEIPISARIMALADIYDAMTSTRCYKEAWSHEKVKTIIVEERGQHLDPRVVDAFLRLEDKWRKVKENFNDDGRVV